MKLKPLYKKAPILPKMSARKVGGSMPYMKYGDWYLPNCNIKFPTETEALEYLYDN